MRERVAKRYFADRRKDFRSLPLPGAAPPAPQVFVQSLWTGVPTATAASCSVKTASAADTVRMVVSTSSDLSSPVYGATAAPDATFHIAKPSISGLTPNTQYYYAIDVNGQVDTPYGEFNFHQISDTGLAAPGPSTPLRVLDEVVVQITGTASNVFAFDPLMTVAVKVPSTAAYADGSGDMAIRSMKIWSN